MEIKSFFYIDQKEFLEICNQQENIAENIAEKDIFSTDIALRTGNIPKLFPSISLNGVLSGRKEVSISNSISIEHKIAAFLDRYDTPESICDMWLSNKLSDGIIFVGKDSFILTNIITENETINSFDAKDNMDYILSRLPESAILVFEANSLVVQEPNNLIPAIEMKMKVEKLSKNIHHYASKIFEYASFNFSVLGEVNTTRKKLLINPIIVWR